MERCACCGKPEGTKYCANCRLVSYCGELHFDKGMLPITETPPPIKKLFHNKDCQIKHWKETHKSTCRAELDRVYFQRMLEVESHIYGVKALSQELGYWEKVKEIFLLKWKCSSLLGFLRTCPGERDDLSRGIEIFIQVAELASAEGKSELARKVYQDLYDTVHEVDGLRQKHPVVMGYCQFLTQTAVNGNYGEVLTMLRKYIAEVDPKSKATERTNRRDPSPEEIESTLAVAMVKSTLARLLVDVLRERKEGDHSELMRLLVEMEELAVQALGSKKKSKGNRSRRNICTAITLLNRVGSLYFSINHCGAKAEEVLWKSIRAAKEHFPSSELLIEAMKILVQGIQFRPGREQDAIDLHRSLLEEKNLSRESFLVCTNSISAILTCCGDIEGSLTFMKESIDKGVPRFEGSGDYESAARLMLDAADMYEYAKEMNEAFAYQERVLSLVQDKKLELSMYDVSNMLRREAIRLKMEGKRSEAIGQLKRAVEILDEASDSEPSLLSVKSHIYVNLEDLLLQEEKEGKATDPEYLSLIRSRAARYWKEVGSEYDKVMEELRQERKKRLESIAVAQSPGMSALSNGKPRKALAAEVKAETGLVVDGGVCAKSKHPAKEEAECSICLLVIEEKGDEETKALSCGHVFHASCICDWFGKCRQKELALNCPYCRTEELMPAKVSDRSSS